MATRQADSDNKNNSRILLIRRNPYQVILIKMIHCCVQARSQHCQDHDYGK